MTKERSLHTLSNWFRSANIPILPSDDDEYDVMFPSSEGDFYKISLTEREGVPRRVGIDFALIPVDDDMRVAFLEIARKAGYTPSWNGRGEAPKRKLNYVEDFDLIVFRHCDLRRVPNPAKASLDAYSHICRSASRFFLSSNSEFCAIFGLELGDLLTYATIWTCNFIGQYELPPERSKNSDNEKLLFRYLQQRFAELRKTAFKRLRSIRPDFDTTATALYERPFDPWVDFEAETAARSAESILSEDHEEESAEIPVLEGRVRRAQAAQRLYEALGRLSHEDLISRLTEVMNNDFCDPVARTEAHRQLVKHQKACPTCVKTSTPEGLEEDEEVASADAA